MNKIVGSCAAQVREKLHRDYLNSLPSCKAEITCICGRVYEATIRGTHIPLCTECKNPTPEKWKKIP